MPNTASSSQPHSIQKVGYKYLYLRLILYIVEYQGARRGGEYHIVITSLFSFYIYIHGEMRTDDCMLLHAFYGKGGGGGLRPPPFIFQRGGGGLFEKRGGGPNLYVRPLPQKLISHHVDTFVMQVSWIFSKKSNEIIIFIIITKMFYSMIYDIILIIELTSDFSLHTIRFSSIYILWMTDLLMMLLVKLPRDRQEKKLS